MSNGPTGPHNPEYVYATVKVVTFTRVRVRADSPEAIEERRSYGGPGGFAEKAVRAAGIGEGATSMHVSVIEEDGGYWVNEWMHRAEEGRPGALLMINSPKGACMTEENLKRCLGALALEGIEVLDTWNNTSEQVSVRVALRPTHEALERATARMADIEPCREWTSVYDKKDARTNLFADVETLEFPTE